VSPAFPGWIYDHRSGAIPLQRPILSPLLGSRLPASRWRACQRPVIAGTLAWREQPAHQLGSLAEAPLLGGECSGDLLSIALSIRGRATASGSSGLSRYGELFIPVPVMAIARERYRRRELATPHRKARASFPLGCCIRRTPGPNVRA